MGSAMSKHLQPVTESKHGLTRTAWAIALAIIVGWCAPAVAAEAEKAKPATTPAKPAAAQSTPDKKIDLRPQEIGGNELVTKDGVQLKATFFPGPKGKESVPVILLHGHKGDRKEFVALAPSLQKQGHAVLTPDLRGHGESTMTVGGRKLDAARFSADQFEQMVYEDMEALRRFLLRKNNDGELNISKLCVVGSEMGALVALSWARYDWFSLTGERPPMHVKALVLLSPPRSMPGLNSAQALNHDPVRRLLSMMILVGKEKAKDLKDAEAIHNMVKRYHPEPPEEERVKRQDLFFFALNTKLQGSKLLGVKTLNVDRMIGLFIDLRLVRQDHPDLAWRERGAKGN